MPAINSGKVLVTGANGYLAIYFVKSLLEAGFSVRGTVRSADKEAFVEKTFAQYGDKLELVVVEDITQDGAFDEAVKGVDAIEHSASPFHFRHGDPDELIAPAVAGTRSILQSALKFGTLVKRVVFTSSTAAVDELGDERRIFTEADWNDQSVDEVRQKGAEVLSAHSYRASKSLSEREAWRFVEEHKADIKWDLVVLNPPWVFGPSLQDITSLSALNASMKIWNHFILHGTMDIETVAIERGFWVDIRDVSAAHVRSLMVEKAGGQRILVVAGSYKRQDWVDAAHAINPTLPVKNTSHDVANAPPIWQLKSNKFEKLLGLKYHSMAETSKAIIDNIQERGLWDGKVAQ